jgi:phospholipase A1
MNRFLPALLVAVCVSSSVVHADNGLDDCLLTQISTADDSLTIGQLRQYCEAE